MSEERFDLRKLKQNPNNPFPFVGTDEQWLKFTESLIEDIEYLEAIKIVYDSSQDNKIVAGNKRHAGLIENEIYEISSNAVLDCKDWSEEKRRRFLIASNKNWGQWSEEIMTVEFEDLMFDYDISFDVYEEEEKTPPPKEEEPSFSITLDFTEDDFREISEKLNAMQGSKEGIIYKLVMAA